MAKAGQKRVAVIGAGASGLPAIKWCIQYGFNVLCYEKQNDIAGLWRYRQTDCDGEGCVMKSTVINTSKEMTAYSDFPPPADYANFMHNSQMLAYLRSYAEHFDLTKHIRFGTTVNNVFRDKDGKWIVQSKNQGERSEESFDGVMICIGRHVEPHMAHFDHEHLFAGKVLHSHSYKDHRGFEDLNVVVVGIGNSGGDVAIDLSRISKQVYLVARRGAWVMGRLSDYGQPFDLTVTKRFLGLLQQILPFALVEKLVAMKLNSRFDHLTYGLRPPHGPLSAHPTVNDELPNRISEGTVRIKPAIKKFTGPKSLQFVDGTEVDDIDAVIVCTGYSFSFPILEDGKLVPVVDNRLDLYKNTFPPHVDRPETVAIVGVVAPLGSVRVVKHNADCEVTRYCNHNDALQIVPISEMQARLFCHVLNGDGRLPDKQTMLDDIAAKHGMRQRRFVASRRHTIEENYDGFMDELAELIGCKPDAMALLKSGRIALAYDVLFRPLVAYQYRLVGPHRWPGAVDAIRGINDRALKATQSTVPMINESNTSGGHVKLVAGVLVLILTLWWIFL